jgi:hypothetical protein
LPCVRSFWATNALASGQLRSIRQTASLTAHLSCALPIVRFDIPVRLPADSLAGRTRRA